MRLSKLVAVEMLVAAFGCLGAVVSSLALGVLASLGVLPSPTGFPLP